MTPVQFLLSGTRPIHNPKRLKEIATYSDSRLSWIQLTCLRNTAKIVDFTRPYIPFGDRTSFHVTDRALVDYREASRQFAQK